MSTAPEQHRYLLGLPREGRSVFLSWRLLQADRPDEPFDVERRRGDTEAWERVTATPILDSTTFLDEPTEPGSYQYRVVAGDGAASESVEVQSGADPSVTVVSVPLDPETKVEPIFALGDVLNDGRVGYVPRVVRAGTIWIAAYSHDGRLLWERDTKLPNRGDWDQLHVPVLCWDVNGDGRTEIAFHTAKQRRPDQQYEGAGADEYLTVVDSETGELVWESPWPAVHPRVMMTVGHLRGLDAPASLVVLDETYADETLTAIGGKAGELEWQVEQHRAAGHNLDIADIDGDGVQEVICAGICYNGDGTVRWEAEPFGHTDISKPARITPDRDGLQIWYAVEDYNPGVYLVDKDGKTIFHEAFRHAHYGWVARHTAQVPGLHPHTSDDHKEEDHCPIYLPDGSHWLNLADWQASNFVPVHWDEGPEVVFIIRKENKRIVRLKETGEIEDLPEGKLPESGRFGRNLGCADIIGDFRENIVTTDKVTHSLIVLANPTVATRRGHSPYDSFEYRHDRSQHGSGYYIYLSPPYTPSVG